MSSIHEALKKAQRDRLAPLPPVAVASKKRNGRNGLWLLVALVVCVDIAIAAWFFWPNTQVAERQVRPATQAPAKQTFVPAQKKASREVSKPADDYSASSTQTSARFEPLRTEPAKPSAKPTVAKPSVAEQPAAVPSVETITGAESESLQQWAGQQTIQALIVKQSKPEKSFAIVSGNKVRRGHRFANGAVVTNIQAGVVEVRDASGRAFIRSE